MIGSRARRSTPEAGTRQRTASASTIARGLDFEKLKGDPGRIAERFVSYVEGFSANVRPHVRVLRV